MGLAKKEKRFIFITSRPSGRYVNLFARYFVIAGMGIGFNNGGGMKGRNRDWKIKSNPFLIGEGKGGIV